MAHQVIMSSLEDNEQFVDTIASPSYSVSITTLPGLGITTFLPAKSHSNFMFCIQKLSGTYNL